MILLCVDGLDPDLVQEYGWDKIFKYNYKLEIPRECFVPDRELGSTPHTTRVWPTIFSGQIIDYGLAKRKGLRKKAHDHLVRAGITWKRRKKRFRISPTNIDLNTIFDGFHSFTWNLPTINPEWISNFPSYGAFVEYCKRELWIWMNMTLGSEDLDFDLEAYYLRYVDFVGHNDWKNLRRAYQTIFGHILDVKQNRNDVIVISDHGCKDGLHTNYAYLGSDEPFEAESVHEIRKDLERIIGGNNGN